jgi:ATP-dependent helicase YprA (DUF1998 family)
VLVPRYHAGKDAEQRARVQAQWTEGSLAIVVATIAFGMGVDKADVRWCGGASYEGIFSWVSTIWAVYKGPAACSLRLIR